MAIAQMKYATNEEKYYLFIGVHFRRFHLTWSTEQNDGELTGMEQRVVYTSPQWSITLLSTHYVVEWVQT
jgi:hypothetical protein